MKDKPNKRSSKKDQTAHDYDRWNPFRKPELAASSSKGLSKHELDPSESLARRLQQEADIYDDDDMPLEESSDFYDDSPHKGKGKEVRSGSMDSEDHESIEFNNSIGRSYTKNTKSNHEEYPDKVQEALKALREYYSRVMATKCHKCSHALVSDLFIKGHIAAWKSRLDSDYEECVSAVKCPVHKCNTKTCLGCGRSPQLGINKATSSGKVLDWCCDGGKLFAIWLFLARYDELELETSEASARAIESAQKEQRQRDWNNSDRGAGYARFDRDTTDRLRLVAMRIQRGLDPHDPGSYGASRWFNFKSSDIRTDKFMKMIAGFLYHLLPNEHHRTSKSSFEMSPPLALKAMLQLSLLLDKLAELLRNDSIGDLTARADLYFKVLRLVQAIGSHRDLVGLVSKERYRKCSTTGLKILSLHVSKGIKCPNPNQNQNLLDFSEDTATSVISHIENLYKQSEIILSQYQKVKTEFADSEGKDTIALCEEIVDSYVKIVDTNKAKGTSIEAKKSEWATFHAENMVEETEDVVSTYHWHPELRELRQMHSLPKGRIPYLVKEIATLATSLPDGVFAKVSPTTPGVLKCLIIGPKDTPYEGGLFEFDIFAGADYPRKPPRVFFRTTANGTVSFNPNLYPNGKTCLSLIGTFPDAPNEMWQANKSTILQVLISIQGMILCEHPYKNIPGNEDVAAEHPSSRLAEARYQALTVAWAMLYYLHSRSQMTGIWAKVIKKHFRIHGKDILKTVNKWARANPRIRTFGQGNGRLFGERSRDLLAELGHALARL